MTGWKTVEYRLQPEPCNECGLVTRMNPLSGLCEGCWPIVYARFVRAMGWGQAFLESPVSR